MTPTMQTKPKARIWVAAVIFGVLFIIITSELPIFESLLPFLWGKLSMLAVAVWGLLPRWQPGNF